MTNIFDMTGETVLITGGGTGLGKQFSKALAKAGATVILAARRVEKLEQTAAEIGDAAHCVAMDVSDSDSIRRALDEVYAIAAPTVLVNNAGASSMLTLNAAPEEEWDQIFNTNVKGAWLLSRAVCERMAETGGGSIVNITSVLASTSQKGTGGYPAAKAGLEHLTRGMALEWARYGVRVNALAPGYYHTDMAGEFLESAGGEALVKKVAMRRLGQPDDMDGAILLLCSNASRYMTGSVITVDGGLSLAVI
jgi:NAD(P)-dependent dehydrogenase (short-subunit alcohol dehydrogenase family)